MRDLLPGIFRRPEIALAAGIVLICFLAGPWFFLSLRPPESRSVPISFEVGSGDGFRTVSRELRRDGIIRSQTAFVIWTGLTGNLRDLKPGIYVFPPGAAAPDILRQLVSGPQPVRVTIPEGLTAYEVDGLLARAGVTPAGDFAQLARTQNIEGRLFPDTYDFYQRSAAVDIVRQMQDNFHIRTRTVLDGSETENNHWLVVASLLEKEVPDTEERRIVAGIIEKRLKAGMPLQVDATICYLKELRASRDVACYPLTPEDFKVDSPYNTYVKPGLPPGPIASPGLLSLQAAHQPIESPYWFYLSDPQTKRTVFAKNFEEHKQNRARFQSAR
ncbi:MAG: endolytic transglycosylase MltG [Candidatus Liptonbacteria bacterium]|nr:endolytic transglycosylase MltG [Candidatus Liptonbacteria bacterium]